MDPVPYNLLLTVPGCTLIYGNIFLDQIQTIYYLDMLKHHKIFHIPSDKVPIFHLKFEPAWKKFQSDLSPPLL